MHRSGLALPIAVLQNKLYITSYFCWGYNLLSFFNHEIEKFQRYWMQLLQNLNRAFSRVTLRVALSNYRSTFIASAIQYPAWNFSISWLLVPGLKFLCRCLGRLIDNFWCMSYAERSQELPCGQPFRTAVQLLLHLQCTIFSEIFHKIVYLCYLTIFYLCLKFIRFQFFAYKKLKYRWSVWVARIYIMRMGKMRLKIYILGKKCVEQYQTMCFRVVFLW